MQVTAVPNDRARALAIDLGSTLAVRGWRVATAESCTGGLVAGTITEIAGSSGWFDRGFVTYSNDAKVQLLGVAPAVLAAHGAVSEAAARAMAEGALARSEADLAVAVTGVAGPGGGSPDKPVGMVCLAWARRDGLVEAATRRFGGDRAAVRWASVEAALAGLVERARRG
jgi:nicotinamide-nucleotide amidase